MSACLSLLQPWLSFALKYQTAGRSGKDEWERETHEKVQSVHTFGDKQYAKTLCYSLRNLTLIYKLELKVIYI